MLINYDGEELDCSTADETTAALAAGKVPRIQASFDLEISTNVRIKVMLGAPRFVARGSSQPSVEAWGSSKPSVVAWESSQPSVVARESSQPSVVARESSQPSVVAWGSSKPSVVAWGSSKPSVVASGICQISIRGAVKIKASKLVAIAVFGAMTATIEGGGFVAHMELSSPREWCEYYGVEVHGECALVYKGLSDTFCAAKNSFLYEPGAIQKDPSWDPNPSRECGGGLHFSPSPRHTFEFAPDAKKFVGCLVPLDSILVHPNGEYPQKVRAPATVGCWECDVDGNWIGELKPDFSKFEKAETTPDPKPSKRTSRKTTKKAAKRRRK